MRLAADLRLLLTHDGFTRLFAVRLVSQCADGLFQIGLAFLYFFDPTRMSTAAGVAGAFAVLLLPFSLIGPFVGPLLDRWRRQRVLLFSALARAIACLGLTGLVLADAHILIISVLALIVLGINRFFLAALSAALPHVVPPHLLLMANSITPTLGAAAAAVGAVAGFILGVLTPAGTARNATSLFAAAALLACSCWAATRIGADELGPDEPAGRRGLISIAAQLAAGARYLVRRRTPAHGLAVMAAGRMCYAVTLVSFLLMSRHLLSTSTGAAEFGLIGGATMIGGALAVALTPAAGTVMAPGMWIVLLLGLSALAELVLAAGPQLPMLLIPAAALGLGVQGAKIAVDTIVQRDVADHMRGRAFSLYDVSYNVALVAGALIASLTLPDEGFSRATNLGLAAAFFLIAAGYAALTRKADPDLLRFRRAERHSG
ncbi:MAG: MFS transporter [Flaviflexus sp.]|nr:MFS transporter [Flaviflexus sp.]